MIQALAGKTKNIIKKFNIAEWLLMVTTFFCLMIFILYVADLRTYSSLLHYSVYPLVWLTSFAVVVKKIKKKEKLDGSLILLICTILFAIIAALTDDVAFSKKLSFSYWNTVLFFITSLSVFYIYVNVPVSKKTLKISTIFIAIIVIAAYFTYFLSTKNDKVMVNGVQLKSFYLTLNFGNANSAGTLLTWVCLCLFVGICVYDKLYIKLILTGFIGAAYFLLTETESRNNILALMIFLFAVTILLLFFKKRKVPSIIWGILFLLPLVVSVAYIAVVDTNAFTKIFGFLNQAGKGIFARKDAWTNAFNRFGQDPIFGVYYNEFTTTNHGPHSELLGILSNFGLITFVFYCLYVYTIFMKLNAKPNTTLRRVGMAAFMGLLYTGFADTYLYSGCLGMFMLVAPLLALANFDEPPQSPLIGETPCA